MLMNQQKNNRSGILLDVRQIAARQYALLTEAPSFKLQAASSKPQAKVGEAPPRRGWGKSSCDNMSH